MKILRNKPSSADMIKLAQHDIEIWMTVPGYDNYQVSNLGRVRNLDKNPIYILRHEKSLQSGYYVVSLSKDGKRHQIAVHRLMAMVFLVSKNADSKNYRIHHRDGNKINNNLSNLYISEITSIKYVFSSSAFDI